MKPNAPRPEACIVGVFAKAPVPGEVKTRLAPLLGREGAAALHAALVRRALETALAANVGEVELWCAPDCSDALFADCARDSRVRLRAQPPGDLGQRMAAAFAAAHARDRAMVLIGSDCPALTPALVRSAADALRMADAVLAPAEDGGYVLVGLARPLPSIFEGVAWSTAAVMNETRARLRDAGAAWHELPVLWDVDRPEDFARLRREGLLEGVLS